MMKEELLKTLAEYALSVTESVSMTKKKKKEVVDTCNKISEVSWILASIAKGKDFGDFNKKIIGKQLEAWSKGEPTSESFKSLYR